MDAFVSRTDIARRYVLADPLGQGNMGTVFHATDRLTGQDVALKQVKRLNRPLRGAPL